MTDLSSELGFRRNRQLGKAVYQNAAFSLAGFSGAGVRAGSTGSSMRRSGKTRSSTWRRWRSSRASSCDDRIRRLQCALLSDGDPAQIDAVDLNPAHVALNKLKLAALQPLPDHDPFRILRRCRQPQQLRRLRPLLRRISMQRRDATGRSALAAAGASRCSPRSYSTGCSGASSARATSWHGCTASIRRAILEATGIGSSGAFFEQHVAPIFDRESSAGSSARRSSLFGLGIPPAQYDGAARRRDRPMADVLMGRLEKLTCDFPLDDNYFAWQAFGGAIATGGRCRPISTGELCGDQGAAPTGQRPSHASFTDMLAEARHRRSIASCCSMRRTG